MDSDTPRAAVWVTAACLVHLLLGAFRLGTESIWLDEMMSIQIATGSPEAMMGWFRFLPEQHPLYYLLLRGWMGVLGDSPAALRSMSLFFGVSTIPLVFLLGSTLVGRTVGILGAFLMALSPFWLYYSQEGRMYTLLVFLVCVSTLLFVRQHRAGREGGAGPILAYWLVAIAGMYTHFFFIFLLFGHALVEGLQASNWRTRLRDVLRLGVPIFLAYLPWMYLLLMGASGGQGWKSIRHVVFGVPYTLVRFAVGYGTFVANYRWQERVTSLLQEYSVVLALAVLSHAVLLVAGLWSWRTTPALNRRLLCATLFVPLLLPLAFSPIIILSGERYFMVALPAYMLGLASGVTTILRSGSRLRVPAILAVTAFAGVTLYAVAAHHLNPDAGKEQWRDVVASLEASAGPTDPVFVAPAMSRAGLLYHAEGLRPELVVGLNGDAAPTVPTQSTGAWLVVARLSDPDSVAASLAPRWEPVERQLFPKTTGLWLIRLRAAGSAVESLP